MNASARWLNGKDLSDALGLGNPGYYYWALVAGQCVFFMCLCYTYRSFDYLDKRKIKALRRIFYHVIVENKEHGLGQETVFDFKYIPNFSMTSTEKGEYQASGIKERGIERRNFKTLVIASTVVGVLSYFGMMTTWGLVSSAKAWWYRA